MPVPSPVLYPPFNIVRSGLAMSTTGLRISQHRKNFMSIRSVCR